MAVVVLLEREFLGGSGNGVISLTASTMSDAPNLLREYSLVFIGGEGRQWHSFFLLFFYLLLSHTC